MNTEQSARHLIEKGFICFPLKKKPTLTGDKYKDSKFFKESYLQHGKIKKSRNIGNVLSYAVKTGEASGLTVVDVDTHDKGVDAYDLILEVMYDKCPDLKLYSVVTGSGGYHLYFQYEPDLRNTTNSIIVGDEKCGIDVRNDNGYIVGPGSAHVIQTLKNLYPSDDNANCYTDSWPDDWHKKYQDAELARYEFENEPDLEIPKMPQFLKDLLTKKTKFESFDYTDIVPNVTEEKRISVQAEIDLSSEDPRERLLDYCPKEKVNDYGEWINLGMIIKKEFGEIDLWINLSKKHYPHCDVGEHHEKWATFGEHKLTFGTYLHWLLEHYGAKEYARIKAKCGYNVYHIVRKKYEKHPIFDQDNPTCINKFFHSFKRGVEYNLFDIIDFVYQSFAIVISCGQLIVKTKVIINGEVEFRNCEMKDFKKMRVLTQKNAMTKKNDSPESGNDELVPTMIDMTMSIETALEFCFENNLGVYERIDFMPNTKEEGIFNLFTGFKANFAHEIDYSRMDHFRNYHMANLLCNNCELSMNYLERYVAHLFQNPEDLPQVSIVMSSIEGCGKSSFWNFIGQIVGRQYYLSTNINIFDKFNSQLESKLLVVIEECKNSSDQFESIKNTITEPRINIERKGVDAYSINNLARYIILSNEMNPVKITANDRRFMVISCNEQKESAEYFSRMINQMQSDEFQDEFYTHYMNMDLSDFNPRVIPETQSKKDMKLLNVDNVYLFCAHLINSGVDKVRADKIYNVYRDWCSEKKAYSRKEQTLKKMVAKVLKKARRQVDGSRAYYYIIEDGPSQIALESVTKISFENLL